MTTVTADDHNLIKNLRIEKHWGAWRMKTEFPNKNWSIKSVNRVIKKIDTDSIIERK